jgi:hypothetical protein
MDSIAPIGIDDERPIFAISLLEVAPDAFEKLYRDIATFMDGEGADIPGVLERQLFGGADKSRIVTVVKFSSHRQWVRAQWNARLGELFEEIALNSSALDFDLYYGDRFDASALAQA